MDALRDDVEDPLRARRREAARLLREQRHRERLVQHAQLAALALLVVRVPEDPAVDQRPVHVGDHRADVARAVRRAARGGVLDAVEVLRDGLVEVHRVALVEGVDLAAGGDFDLRAVWDVCVEWRGGTYVWVGEDELPEGGVERVAVHTFPCREDQVDR